MNLFNLLCVSKSNNTFGDLALFIIPFISTLLLICGIILICNNIEKKEKKSLDKLKRGTIAFSISIVLIVISMFIMNANANSLNDPCGSMSPFYSVTKALFNIEKILIPLAFIVMAFFKTIEWIICNNKDTKKRLGQDIVRCLVIALSIFFIMIIIDVLFAVFVDVPKTDGWATCWCK